MAIPQQTIAQRDFSAGEIDPIAIRRDDLDQFKDGVRFSRNFILNDAEGLTRRPGRDFLYEDSGRRDEFRPTSNDRFYVSFRAGSLEVRDENGVSVTQFAAPWGANDTLVWEMVGSELYIAWDSGVPYVLVYSELTGTFTLNEFAFDTKPNGAIQAPFYRYAPKGVTMQPSARTGSVTLTFDAAVAEAGMVGTHLRYAGRQMVVSGYTSATQLSATIVEELPPTLSVTVANTSGFDVGDSVISDQTSTEGVVVEIVSSTVLKVLITKNFFQLLNGEYLAGPNASSKISANPTETSPGATVVWDEAFMSDFRGWPRSVSQDRQRLIFCDFPQFKQAICWSAINGVRDFLITADAIGAIFEYIPKQCRVLHVTGGYDEFAFTDAGVFYIPISSANPLQPGSVEFREIVTISCSQVRPILTTEAVIFVDSTGKRIHAITATGQVSRPYISGEITKYHHHLFTNIVELAAVSSADGSFGQVVYVVDGSGLLITGKYTEGKNFVGWLVSDGQGVVETVSARYGEVLFTVNYNGATIAERLSEGRLMDASMTLHDDAGSPSALTISDSRLLAFAGGTIDAMIDGFFVSGLAVSLAGEVTLPYAGNNVVAGKNFTPKLTPLFPSFEGGEKFGQRARRRKITKSLIRVLDTQQFQIGARQYGSYRQGENQDIPVAVRDDVYLYRDQGRSFDPAYTIEQPVAGQITIAEITTEVTV